MRTCRGGRSEGVHVVEIDNGTMSIDVLPTRGMGIWRVRRGEKTLGWQSPVREPVHPAFVPLFDPSGLGWLDGFDELLCRCGLESNGPPEFERHRQAALPAARPHRQHAGPPRRTDRRRSGRAAFRCAASSMNRDFTFKPAADDDDHHDHRLQRILLDR